MGGESPHGTFDNVEAYAPSSDRWTKLPALPAARHGTGAAVVGNVLFLPAGGPLPGGSESSTMQAFT